MRKKALSRIVNFLIILGLFASFSTSAQVYREQFGRNRIQYKNFDWQFYYSDNFEVYFYNGGKALAQKAINYLEEEFSRVTELVGYHPYSKTRVFLYNSETDKQQSNVGVKGRDFTIGGQTNFVKSQVEVGYPGDYTTFRSELVFNFSEMLITEMLYGGSIAEMFQTTFSTPIPDWFIQGVAAYVANGWNKEMDDAVREFVQDNQKIKLTKLSSSQQLLIGQSIWNFAVQRYGQRSVSNVLNLARLIRNEELSFGRSLGVPFNTFIDQWKTFYENINQQLVDNNYQLPVRDEILAETSKEGERIVGLRISPDGKMMAYAREFRGSFEIQVVNLETRQTQKIHQGGVRLLDQESALGLPLLSWADELTVGIVSHEYGKNILTIKRVGAKGAQRIEIPRLNQIRSFDFKSKGRLAVMSADIGGQSDIYLYNINRNSVRRVTNDGYDDLDARFIPETNKVIFSSNRENDSVFVKAPEALKDLRAYQYNLFVYDLDTTDSLMSKLTNNLARDLMPVAESEFDVYYVSDQQGVNNFYRYDLVDSVATQLTNWAYGIRAYDVDFTSNRLAFISTVNGSDAIFLSSFNKEANLFTPLTPRRVQFTTSLLAERRRQRLFEQDSLAFEQEEVPTILKEEDIPKRDSIKTGAINTEDYKFEEESVVDTKNYRFEKPEGSSGNPTARPARQNSFLSIYRNTSRTQGVQGPIGYETRFMTDNLVTTFVIDELRSFSQLIEIQMNDFLENHRFHGGILIPYNFNSGFDVFAEYQYLKHFFDFKAKYFRKTLQRENILGNRHRYVLNRVEVGAAVPLTPSFRVEVAPFFSQTQFLDLSSDILLNRPVPGLPNNSLDTLDTRGNYLGGKVELVFDNSFVTGTNLHEGTRAKLIYENHFGISSDAASFGRLQLDARHYQRLTKGIFFASRLFFGSYFGKSPKQYLLGGVDNWAFNRTESTGEISDPLALNDGVDNSDLLFHQFTNLRGYNYNTFQGRNVLTFSAEVRLPIQQLLNNRDLRSSFLRNLQFVGFYDIGSAWNDLSPFKEQNNLNTEIIQEGESPFSAVINNFSNPWLQSTGVGMRTMLFGFFSRIDVAWPIRNFEVRDPVLQVSIGYDF